MELIIRSASESDASWIKEIYKKEKEHIGSFDLFMVWQNYLKKTSNNKFMVIDDIAFCHYKWSPRANSYVIEEIAVREDFKGKGVGKFIVTAMMSKAQREGKKLTIKCNDTNTSANLFYEACGMKLDGICFTRNKGTKMRKWTT
jgi:GNAT superfamily N-acetyltransferase